MCVCVYMHTYVYMFIYIHTHTSFIHRLHIYKTCVHKYLYNINTL